MKTYKTNKFKSVAFYFKILWPILIIIITIPMVRDFKNSWLAMLIFYPFFFLLEFLAIKYWKKEISIDDKEIVIKSSNLIYKANWKDIIDLKEFLFGQGEFFYELKTKNKKKLGFTSSIENCDELLKEIEQRTDLKFKQRL